MTLRLPQNLDSHLRADRSMDSFYHEVLAEKAAVLGRAGKNLAAALEDLRRAESGARDALVKVAADAAHAYFIQRELCGLYDNKAAIADYAIPGEVLARVGAR